LLNVLNFSLAQEEDNLTFSFLFLTKVEICLKYCDYSNQTIFYYWSIFSC